MMFDARRARWTSDSARGFDGRAPLFYQRLRFPRVTSYYVFNTLVICVSLPHPHVSLSEH
jgi:hypothetical protein